MMEQLTSFLEVPICEITCVAFLLIYIYRPIYILVGDGNLLCCCWGLSLVNFSF